MPATHHSSAQIHEVLRQYWGFSSFRPLQEEVIGSVLDGKDTLAIMPTGGGKSLCYQVPAMVSGGLCLVITPLIALMKDQVENLRRKNITAYAIYSGMTRKEVINILQVAGSSNCRFLYVSPERLETSLFKEYLPGLHITLVAVDEAHCISQWGYDFRPPYLRIAALKDELPGIPFIALTASATPAVQQDICEKLGNADRWKVFRQSFERANLSYSVFHTASRINKLIDILQHVPGSSIVYCRSRRRTREVSDLLKLQHIPAEHYHAGLPQEERSRKQEAWVQNKIRVMVCTNAFGMGIDKPDVRTVVHADVPDCLENYYQEAGRAGRDGKRAYAVLLYDDKDLEELEQLAALRFPSIEEIRNVYQSVANYLQLPAGAGEGQYYDFDLPGFLQKFKLEGHTALYGLKALEQEGWLAFSEQFFMPARAGFLAGKQTLYEFETNHPALEPCIKTLLRAYEGIFDQVVPISEKLIAGMMRTEAATVQNQLQQLHQAGIIDYQPLKDKPQLCLLRPRIKTDELTINQAAYKERKKQFTARVQQMADYIHYTSGCRSRFIAAYFGDEAVPDCGICDNCLKKKETPLSKEEFDAIHQRVISVLQKGPLPVKELMNKLETASKEKAWQVIEFLQAENKITVSGEGMVGLP